MDIIVKKKGYLITASVLLLLTGGSHKKATSDEFFKATTEVEQNNPIDNLNNVIDETITLFRVNNKNNNTNEHETKPIRQTEPNPYKDNQHKLDRSYSYYDSDLNGQL